MMVEVQLKDVFLLSKTAAKSNEVIFLMVNWIFVFFILLAGPSYGSCYKKDD